ncbi:helix-turn-helix domain-containing protein [Amantichitinum ursilacus]|uniref:Helix-turn-helix protein n=1 Tax=Amantichitinum ursilacus TaxID=857265 RepID=A0A0N0XLA9_9NEIS|nr:helix-turn-helix transcriptional regulator [Amantichitinum ursilacus]KPC55047.1 helix-turn-helix protein [Amantichitinum ursilacus]
MALELTHASDNVFEDLGFDPEVAKVMAMRVDLMVAIERAIREKEWTQIEAAEVLGTRQSRVSDLVRGKADKFTLDTLIEMAARIGTTVRMTIEQTNAPHGKPV